MQTPIRKYPKSDLKKIGAMISEELYDSGSTATSTNSLFSLNRRASYSSVIDHYLEEAEDEPTALTLNYSSRNRRSSVAAPAMAQAPDPLPTPPANDKLVVILVGLPASGKSTVSNHLIQYLGHNPATQHMRCKIFNAGQVRRKLSCRGRPMMLANNSSEDLFNPKNSQKKEQYARLTLEQMFSDLDKDLCDIAIFDATNSTEKRRAFLFQEMRLYNADLSREFHITPLVFQVSCAERNFVRFNIHNKTFNQDYFDKPYEFAVRDFARRLSHYYSQFTPFSTPEFNSQMAENKLINDDNGLFWFSIVNAGQSDQSDFSACHFPPKASKLLFTLIKTIKTFVDTYGDVYGRPYIQHAGDFAKGIITRPTELTARASTTQVDVPYFSILNQIVNDDYFAQLSEASPL